MVEPETPLRERIAGRSGFLRPRKFHDQMSERLHRN